NVAHASGQLIVISRRNVQKLYAPPVQVVDRLDNVIRRERTMLDTFAVVEVEILFDLRLLLAFGRLIDRELNKAVPVAHYLTHERRILRRDILVVEGQDVS